ncbi:MAG: four-carbon acid sugar kinase family protein [Acidimicrobiales bacterium]
MSLTPSVLVIADDLTGANAAAVLFARLGLRTRTLLLGSDHKRRDLDVDVVVITTGSRRLAPDNAAERARTALSAVEGCEPQLFIKRVDTTLRGPIGAELAVILAWLRSRRQGRVAALAVPAYPAARRTTVGGVHLLDGTPIALSSAVHDEATPLKSSRVAELVTAGTTLTTTELHGDILDRDDEALAGALAKALKAADVTVVDAVTDAHLNRLATAAARVRPRMGDIVVVDSGPFGASYCDALKITGPPRSPVLLVVGSLAEMTRLQVETVNRRSHAKISTIDEHLTPDELVHLALTGIDAGATVTGWHAVPQGVTADKTWATNVPSMLAAATRRTLVMRPVAGVFACGGEMAAAVLDALDARGLEVKTEVEPLVVAGRIIGGPWDRLPIVTKGGLVGNRNTITTSIGHIYGMHETLAPTTEASEVLHS